jgi:hypothetical protein
MAVACRRLPQRRARCGRAAHTYHSDALRYEVMLTDPNVYTRPWKMSMVLYRQLDDNAT